MKERKRERERERERIRAREEGPRAHSPRFGKELWDAALGELTFGEATRGE